MNADHTELSQTTLEKTAASKQTRMPVGGNSFDWDLCHCFAACNLVYEMDILLCKSIQM